jgi:predicted amidohydrolase
MIVDPWGRVVAMRASGEGIVKAEIDLDALERIRRGLPSLRHIRPALR